MRKQCIAIGLTLAMLASAAVPASDIYKWVDEDGNVHFGDRPVGDDSERLDIESRPTDPARVEARTVERKAERFEAQQEKYAAQAEAQAGQPTEAERQATADERAQKCTAYKAQLEAYVNNRRLYKMSADGEREYLSDDEITQARDLAAQRVDEWCP